MQLQTIITSATSSSVPVIITTTAGGRCGLTVCRSGALAETDAVGRTVSETMLPEHSEDKNSRYKRDEGGSVASRVHLFEVGEVCCLKCKKRQNRIK